MKIPSSVTVKSEGGVAGERRLVGITKFYLYHSIIMNIQSDWMSNTFFAQCINLHYVVPYSGCYRSKTTDRPGCK